MGANVSDLESRKQTARIGVVAIGRNEGERLQRCLASVVSVSDWVVYVDSGSTDDSIAMAQRLGAEIVELDLQLPFTAARARNAGLAKLRSLDDGLKYVQFVDGDCEVVDGWLEQARAQLEADEQLAVVCGRRRERHPTRTIYNQLCDIEWDTPIGNAKYCGGDAMMRIRALQAVGGYDDTLIAGEEPELCVRLRSAGWTIRRLDHEMTLHDAAMDRFGQWWKRTVRAGHAYAEGTALHGGPPEYHFNRETRSGLFWGLCVPILALSLAWPTNGLSLLLFAGYPVLFFKIFRAVRDRIGNRRNALVYSLFVVIAKLPEAIGQLTYRWSRVLGRRRQLIEYK